MKNMACCARDWTGHVLRTSTDQEWLGMESPGAEEEGMAPKGTGTRTGKVLLWKSCEKKRRHGWRHSVLLKTESQWSLLRSSAPLGNTTIKSSKSMMQVAQTICVAGFDPVSIPTG